MKRKPINDNDAAVIELLQDNLGKIRNLFGWSAEELGDMVGLTKQTISNLETNSSAMTKTQYLALMSVIDVELAARSDEKLKKLIYTILEEDYHDPEEIKKIAEKENEANIAAEAAIAGGVAATATGALVAGGLGTAGALIGAATIPGIGIPLAMGLTATALVKKFSKKEKKKEK